MWPTRCHTVPASLVLAMAEPSARLPAARQVAQDSTALAPARMSSRRDTDELRAPSEPTDRENYAQVEDNPVKRAAEQPVSTFSIDVDTGAYANVRRFQRRPAAAARRGAGRGTDQLFRLRYPPPDGRQPPFRVNTELAPTPWNPKPCCWRSASRGYELPRTQLPPANLVFLIDVSGLDEFGGQDRFACQR